MNTFVRRSLLWFLVIGLVSCQAPVSYRKEQATLVTPSKSSSSLIWQAHQRIIYGNRSKLTNPREAAGQYVEAARLVAPMAAAGQEEARSLYNHAVARTVETLDAADALPWGTKMALSSGMLRGKLEPRAPRMQRDFIPCDTIHFYGKEWHGDVVQGGIGAPLVAADRHSANLHASGEIHVHTALTAMLLFHGREATLELYDPYETKKVSLAGRSINLAANYTAPVQLFAAVGRPDKLGIVRLLRPERYANTARLTRLQTYDAKRIPVLFIHGLQDTPATWMPMYYQLLRDPDLRDRYQFWAFSYPSGYPFPYSATLLRREMDKVRKECPDHKDIILVGHSMGGLLTRLMVTDAEDHLWRRIFGRSPEETKITGANRKLLMNSLVFQNRSDVHEVVFISTPHRGSLLATNWIGRFGSKLVRLPSALADVRNSVASLLTVDSAAMSLDRMPNSIDTLAPTNRFMKAMNSVPIAPGVTYHSIMGDRGRGDTPNSSDGVVAYWSSHLDGAVSEKIVPSHHSAHQNPQGIAEVRRILRQAAGLR